MKGRQVVVAARSIGRVEPTGAEPITAEMIAEAANLRIIAMHGVGLNHIDQEAAEARGIVVKAVPGGNADAVADLTWGLMFAVSRRIAEADAAVRQGEWGKFIGHSVSKKTLGIVGFGAIGKAVARRASGFSMVLLAYDVLTDEATAQSLNVEYVSLDTLLEQSDFVTLYVPLMDATRGLIGERELAMMKPSAVLVNVSRGGVVDEQALCHALHEGSIAGAGIDVYSEEPIAADHGLLQAPNCVLTPHIGGRSVETIRHIGIETARNILEALQ